MYSMIGIPEVNAFRIHWTKGFSDFYTFWGMAGTSKSPDLIWLSLTDKDPGTGENHPFVLLLWGGGLARLNYKQILLFFKIRHGLIMYPWPTWSLYLRQCPAGLSSGILALLHGYKTHLLSMTISILGFPLQLKLNLYQWPPGLSVRTPTLPHGFRIQLLSRTPQFFKLSCHQNDIGDCYILANPSANLRSSFPGRQLIYADPKELILRRFHLSDADLLLVIADFFLIPRKSVYIVSVKHRFYFCRFLTQNIEWTDLTVLETCLNFFLEFQKPGLHHLCFSTVSSISLQNSVLSSEHPMAFTAQSSKRVQSSPKKYGQVHHGKMSLSDTNFHCCDKTLAKPTRGRKKFIWPTLPHHNLSLREVMEGAEAVTWR